MEDPLIRNHAAYQPYFAAPFAVRGINGRPFGCAADSSTRSTDMSLAIKDPDTAFVQSTQRPQRQSHETIPPRAETNIHGKPREPPVSKSSHNFQGLHGHPPRPIFPKADHVKMLKRNSPAYDSSYASSKRPRVTETQHREHSAASMSLHVDAQDTASSTSIYDSSTFQYNPLQTTCGPDAPLQANPLKGALKDTEHAILDYPSVEQDQDLKARDLARMAWLLGTVDLTGPTETAGMSGSTQGDTLARYAVNNLPIERQYERADGPPLPSRSPPLSIPTLGAEAASEETTSAAFVSVEVPDLHIANVLSEVNASSHANPVSSSIKDEDFIDQVKQALARHSKRKTANVFRRQARRISQLLEVAKPPDASEAVFVPINDTSDVLESGNYFPGPIIFEKQQQLPLQTGKQFLEEFYDDSAKVWIQDPSIPLARNVPHAREITIGQLKQRFLQPTPKGQIPWNCLEMATHVDEGLRPAALNNEDCRLLTKLKLPGSNDSASRRGYEPGWKEVEKWTLLAQGGALTEPHQDSHGYSTYITVNQGLIGFGWLSNPTPEEREAWRDKPATYTGGRWRYVVLRPGQTVYFPCGTVHFVFRLASTGDTLAFGGHVLRCSQIVRWIETMLEEKSGPDVTNEYLTVSAPAYLDRVEKFVKQARESGEVERWGGEEAIEKFLRLKEVFMQPL